MAGERDNGTVSCQWESSGPTDFVHSKKGVRRVGKIHRNFVLAYVVLSYCMVLCGGLTGHPLEVPITTFWGFCGLAGPLTVFNVKRPET